MDRSYNLVDQPFIPCINANGQRVELGLRDTLVRARELREIRDDSPLVTVALHRLLLAILHRVFGPKSLSEWGSLFVKGHWDPAPLGAYFSRWMRRFDLFSDNRPFYQTAGMETPEPLPAVSLYDQFSAGHNATLFDHTTDLDTAGLTPAEAARGLVARQAFAIGFGKSPVCKISGREVPTGYRTDAPLTRGATMVINGANLFETLACNLTAYKDDPAQDLPVWEQDDPERLMDQKLPNGRIDLYTWQSRRLRLILAEDDDKPPRVGRVHFAQGRSLHKDVSDPMKPYRRDEQRAWVPFTIDPRKAVWRDSASLLQIAHRTDRDQPPSAIQWAARAVGYLPPARAITLAVYGVATDTGKAASLLLWRHETMPLPLVYLGDEVLLSCLAEAIAAAEQAADALRNATWALGDNLCPGSGGGKERRNRIRDFVQGLQADTRYWAQLEQPFRRLLLDLPGDEPHRSACRTGWADTVLAAAHRSFDQIVEGLGDSSRVLRAVYSDTPWGARKTLNIALSQVHSRTKETAHEPTRAD